MKKFALMLALALPVAAAFTSCGSDEDGITLDQTSITINYDGSAKLKASESKGLWSSSNEFVASVDDKGEVKANHVGEAIISVSKDGNTATCKVTVVPTDNSYLLPILTWGASQTAVENAVPNTLIKDAALSDNTTLFYVSDNNNAYPWYIYTFVNNSLNGASFTVSFDELPDVLAWMDQYGKTISENDDTFVYKYINGSSVSQSTMNITVAGDANNDIVTTTFSQQNTKSADNHDAIAAKHAAIAAKKAGK